MRKLKYKPVVAVDFDGTLIFNKYPILENPNMRLIKYIQKHRNEYTWILWTNRSGDKLQEAIDYMASFGITFDYVNENTIETRLMWGDSRKVWANYYIDDKSATLSRIIYNRIFRRI